MQSLLALRHVRVLLLTLAVSIVAVRASAGDSHQIFDVCMEKCVVQHRCEPPDDDAAAAAAAPADDDDNGDGLVRSVHPALSAMHHRLFGWSCSDHCTYDCMWETVAYYEDRDWPVPQFFGKWPFVRLLGVQEPASAVFSVLNFVAHWKGIQLFRRKVRPDGPMYYAWHVFCGICLNGWIWSTVFHIRDVPFTEMMDYTCAYLMVLASLVCMLLRMIHKRRNAWKALLTFGAALFFVRHLAFVTRGRRFDYGHNMRVNVITGIAAGCGWMLWYFAQSRGARLAYAWKMAAFQVLAAAALSLELVDAAPLCWTLDTHAVWHAATVPLTRLLYSFLIDDCVALRLKNYDYEYRRLL